MKFKTSSAGFDISFTAPDSVEEYDQLAGSGQCLKDAIAETTNRATVLAWQAEFSKLLADRTGIPRETDSEATTKLRQRSKGAKEVLERFSSYVKRVNDEYANGDTNKRAELEQWAQETADKIPVDPSRQRPGKIAQGDLAKATDVLSGTPDSIEEKVQKYLQVVPGFDLQRDASNLPEKNSLAKLIGEYVNKML
jgi:hypothetical protein